MGLAEGAKANRIENPLLLRDLKIFNDATLISDPH